MTDVVTIRARLRDYDTIRKLLGMFGKLLRDQAVESFREQAFEGKPWARLYGDQPSPFLNIAGALSDFNRGLASPKPNRFNDYPALRDTDALMHSVHQATNGNTVEVKSNLDYAGIHNEGGKSVQKISPTAKSRIAGFLFEGRAMKEATKGTALGAARALTGRRNPQNQKYVPKLVGLLYKDELVTEVIPRQYLGITEKNLEDMVGMVEEEIGGGGRPQ